VTERGEGYLHKYLRKFTSSQAKKKKKKKKRKEGRKEFSVARPTTDPWMQRIYDVDTYVYTDITIAYQSTDYVYVHTFYGRAPPPSPLLPLVRPSVRAHVVSCKVSEGGESLSHDSTTYLSM